MRRHLVPLALVAGLLAALVAASPASDRPGEVASLRAGIAAVDITPALGDTMLGFVRPDIPTDGVHTRLTGRALVLDDGAGQPLALLATDLGFALRKDDVVARVADLGYTDATVVYHSSHTHAGPEGLDDWQVDQLARAIRTAHGSRVPVVAGWGSSQRMDVNRNRSIEAHLANHGQDLFYGQGHHDDDPDGIEHTRDTTVRVLRIDRADGSGPLTAWTHFPVHLTTVTPANSLWDADLAGTATHHLEEAVGAAGFTAAYANGAQGDLMPRFDSFNPQALVDLHGRRLAAGALEAWRHAGHHLSTDLPVQVAWTRSCYCGQEVDDEGHRVSDHPVWGLPFLGGSEDGASIFHEPLQTEGRRLPAELAHPVHGRKIVAAPSEPIGVHDLEPEFAAVRVGDRVMLTSPGEPSVEMGRRFVAAVRDVLPADVADVFNLGLANGYLGYLVTPEEYDMQHYEGGHTVYGKWTSLLAQHELRAAVERLAAGEEGPDGDLGGDVPPATDPVLGDGGVAGVLVAAPAARYERMDVVELAWTGAEGGVDRPVDTPFIELQRHAGTDWVTEESDLGVAMVWRQEGDRYTARIDLRRDLPLGTYRVVVSSGAYALTTEWFRVGRATDVRLRGAELVRRSDGRDWIRIVAQNPPPDPGAAVLWRPVASTGGTVVVEKGGERRVARWDARLRGWVVPDWQPGCAGAEACPDVGYHPVVPAGGVRDGAGNSNAEAVTLDLAAGIAPADWPGHIGVGGGRTPGFGGEGSFPP